MVKNDLQFYTKNDNYFGRKIWMIQLFTQFDLSHNYSEAIKRFFGTVILQNFKSYLYIQESKYPANCSEQSH